MGVRNHFTTHRLLPALRGECCELGSFEAGEREFLEEDLADARLADRHLV